MSRDCHDTNRDYCDVCIPCVDGDHIWTHSVAKGNTCDWCGITYYEHCQRVRAGLERKAVPEDCNIGLHSFAEVDSTGWEVCIECGARRHPERIREAKRKNRLGRYRVQFSVNVDAESIDHAKNIVQYELRNRAPRLEFDGIVLTQKIARK